MRLEVTRIEGRRNDLLLRIERDELAEALLSIANRDVLMALPGMPRHRDATEDEAARMAAAKEPLSGHLLRLGIVGADGRAQRRAIVVSNRNLGTNAGHLAWQRGASPPLFRILEDPLDYGAYSSLTWRRDRRLSIEDLQFEDGSAQVSDRATGRDLSGEIEWATFGQRIVRGGRATPLEEIVHQFYDVRHVLAFEHHRAEGQEIRRAIYRGYPATFRANVLAAWRERGVPRARYVHNAIGLSNEAVIVLQREGTIEEIAAALIAAGAEDGLILDNGGSVACWVWWANDYAGGIVSPTVDYRPPGTSAIAFVLKGPVKVDLPGGSVSPSVC